MPCGTLRMMDSLADSFDKGHAVSSPFHSVPFLAFDYDCHFILNNVVLRWK